MFFNGILSEKVKLFTGQLCYEISYQTRYSEDFGHIMGLVFRFSGTGSVDFIETMGADGKIVFERLILIV